MRLRLKPFCAAFLAAGVLAGCAATSLPPRLASDAVIDAAERAPLHQFAASGHWNEPFAPFTIIGNIHYVGTEGVSAFLITTPKGHILIDGILAQSVPQIISNIQTLGFDIRDVKYLLNSHAHIDHAGGLAGLQRASGAKMVASRADRPTLEAGAIGFGPTKDMPFPPVRVDRAVEDGDSVSLGGVTLTAHLTPGHTQGCTSWSMIVKGADGAHHTALFHCSTTVAGQSLVPESWPGMIAAFRATFAKLRAMQVDIFLAAHGSFFGLAERRARQLAGDANAFVDSAALENLNAESARAFEMELTRQQGTAH
jgi:metallo-beta-lactamase class B